MCSHENVLRKDPPEGIARQNATAGLGSEVRSARTNRVIVLDFNADVQVISKTMEFIDFIQTTRELIE